MENDIVYDIVFVLIVKGNQPRSKWRMGKIMEVTTGKDGQVVNGRRHTKSINLLAPSEVDLLRRKPIRT